MSAFFPIFLDLAAGRAMEHVLPNATAGDRSAQNEAEGELVGAIRHCLPPAPAVRRRRIEFRSQQAILCGYLFSAPQETTSSGTLPPVVVLTHGFSATQSMGLTRTAECICTRTGCAALTFDHKGFGESGGPRHHFCRWTQCVAYLDAVTYLVECEKHTVDVERVVLWGESASSRLVFVAGAIEPRVCCNPPSILML